MYTHINKIYTSRNQKKKHMLCDLTKACIIKKYTNNKNGIINSFLKKKNNNETEYAAQIIHTQYIYVYNLISCTLKKKKATKKSETGFK